MAVIKAGRSPSFTLDQSFAGGTTHRFFFPEDLGTTRISRFMSFEAYKVNKPDSNSEATPGQPSGVACLPIPANINDSYGWEYSSAPLGPAYFDINDKKYMQWIQDLGAAGYQSVVSQLKALTGSPSAETIAKNDFGAVNPHLINLFEGLGFKNHSFFFTLIAKSKKESDDIRKIINFFKYYASPDFVNNRNLTLPHRFRIKYNDSSITSTTTDNKYLPKFNSDCHLTDMQVLYNGNGQPVFFKNSGAPVEVQLALAFRETEIVTRLSLENKNAGDLIDVFEGSS